MNKLLITTLLLASIVPFKSALADVEAEYHDHHCGGGVNLVITAEDRFDPLVQQLMLKQQLEKHPVIDEPRFVVIPTAGNEALTESQIRYIEELLGRQE